MVYGLPSDLPLVLALDANPVRPSRNKASVGGSVFRRPTHLKPAEAAAREDHSGIFTRTGFLCQE